MRNINLHHFNVFQTLKNSRIDSHYASEKFPITDMFVMRLQLCTCDGKKNFYHPQSISAAKCFNIKHKDTMIMALRVRQHKSWKNYHFSYHVTIAKNYYFIFNWNSLCFKVRCYNKRYMWVFKSTGWGWNSKVKPDCTLWCDM